MPSSKPQIKVQVTLAQKAAIDEATRKSGLSASKARREALRLFCNHHGVPFPDDMLDMGMKRTELQIKFDHLEVMIWDRGYMSRRTIKYLTDLTDDDLDDMLAEGYLCELSDGCIDLPLRLEMRLKRGREKQS